jgi:aquaporin Z
MKKYWAEFIGTFALVLVGCGTAAIFTKFTGNLALAQVGIAFAFGLTVLAMVYAIGNISGCHINPAISLAMLVAGRLNWKDTIFYIIFQCAGAVLAAAALWFILSGMPDYSLATNGLGQNGYGAFSPGKFSLLSCFVAEVLFTALFLFVIFGAYTSGMHTHHRYLSKSCPQFGTGSVCWRCSPFTTMAFLGSSHYRRCAGGNHLEVRI